MPGYKCLNCKRVFYGWAIRYRYKYKCPVCGSELREVPSNNKTGNKKFRSDPIVIKDPEEYKKW